MIVIYVTLVWNNDTSRHFFLFFQNFDFLGFQGVKWQIMAQNDKKLCLLYYIFHEAYMIWFWSILVHMCKVMTSQDAFFIVLKFWFFQLLEGCKGKKWPKMTNHSACLTLYLQFFFVFFCFFHFFQNSDFFGF